MRNHELLALGEKHTTSPLVELWRTKNSDPYHSAHQWTKQHQGYKWALMFFAPALLVFLATYHAGIRLGSPESFTTDIWFACKCTFTGTIISCVGLATSHANQRSEFGTNVLYLSSLFRIEVDRLLEMSDEELKQESARVRASQFDECDKATLNAFGL